MSQTLITLTVMLACSTCYGEEEEFIYVDTIMINACTTVSEVWDNPDGPLRYIVEVQWFISYWDDLVIRTPLGMIYIPMFFRRGDTWCKYYHPIVQCTDGWCSRKASHYYTSKRRNWIGRTLITVGSNYDVSQDRIIKGMGVVAGYE